LTEDDKFDMFLDFIYSDEWLLPIDSFIEYNCLIFTSADETESMQEKTRIYNDYRDTIANYIDKFLRNCLGMNRGQLGELCANFQDELDYDDMVHFLALEDYQLFHQVMFEANK